MFPCGSDRFSPPQRLDQPPQILCRKTAAQQRIAGPNARCAPTAFPMSTVRVAENPPCSNAVLVRRNGSSNVPMAHKRAPGATDPAGHHVKSLADQPDFFPVPVEHAHRRSIRIGPTGLNYTRRKRKPPAAPRRSTAEAPLPNSSCTPDNHNLVASTAALRYNRGK